MTDSDSASHPAVGDIGYLPGLDGLRAISILAVTAYHLDLSWAAGGYLGVEVFFVVSGYLITLLALDERHRTGTIGRLSFWARRARRLLPAVVVLVVAVLAWSAVVLGLDEFHRNRGDGVASLLYVQNWHSIATDQPYFVSFGRPPPLRHLWSLAIEEQFYLLWPLLLPLSLRRLGRPTTLWLVLAGAAGSIWLMGALGDIAAPERAYYGTDTRAFGILVGCALAFIWRPHQHRHRLEASGRRTIAVAGVGALAVLAWQFRHRSEFDPWTYPWGFVLVDVCAAVLIVAGTHPSSPIRRTIGSPALAALGRRSYSIYLWHWPVIVFTRPGRDWPLDGASGFVGRLVLIAALSEASYRWIEQPFRDRRAQARIRSALVSARTRPRHAVALAAGAVAVYAVVFVALAAPAPERPVAAGATPVTIATGPIAVLPTPPTTSTTISPTTVAPTTTAAAPALAADPAPVPVAPPPTEPPPTAPAPAPADPPPPPGPDVTVVGESVTVGAVGTLQEMFGGRIQIDAVEGRSFSDGVAVIEALATAGRLTPTVVLHLGNNGAVPEGAMDRVMAAVGPDRRLVLMTVRVPRRWEGQVNATMVDLAQTHESAVLADWYHMTGAEPGLLSDDGVHLTDQGKLRYTDLVRSMTG